MNQNDEFLTDPETEPGQPNEWSDDGIEIASEHDFAQDIPKDERSWFGRFIELLRRKKTDSQQFPTDDPLFSDPEGMEHSRKLIFRGKRSKSDTFEDGSEVGLAYEPDVYSKKPGTWESDDNDLFTIGTNAHHSQFGNESDFDAISQTSVNQEFLDDDYAVLEKGLPVKKIEEVFKAEIENGSVEIVDDEYSVGSSASFTTNSAAELYAEQEAEVDLNSKDLEDFQAGKINTRPNLSESFQNRLGDLAQILENPIPNYSDEASDSLVLVDTDDEGLQATFVETPRTNIFMLLGSSLWRLLRWLVGIPKRSVTNTGTSSDLNRSRLEPLLLAMPAIFIVSYVYRTQIYYQTTDQLRRVTEFSRISRRLMSEGEWQGAYIAIRQVCDAAPTPKNRWNLAEILMQSDQLKYRELGNELVKSLATPENGNLADAHFFLARAIWNSQNLNVENAPRYIAEVQNHLRTALSSEPNRFEILEMLLDILISINETEEVSRLVAPRLERWPLGHYYLARVAFLRNDRISQQISASFMVNRYEGQPNLIQESFKDRERYLLCLALSGQWEKAQPLLDELLKSQDGKSSVTEWKNRFLTIRAIQLLDKDPDEYEESLQEVIENIEKYPNNKDLWNVLTRFADRRTPDAEKYYKIGIELIRKYESSLDYNDLMIWGNLSRKRDHSEMARALLERSVRLNPDNAIAANNLANLLYKLEPKDYKRALALMEQVVKAEPENAIFLETRGQIYALVGQDARAIEDLNKCISVFPNIPEIHDTLVKLYRNQGMLDLAKSHENRANQIRQNLASPNSEKSRILKSP